MPAMRTENYREIERAGDRSRPTRSVINGGLWNRTPSLCATGEGHESMRAGETIELAVWD